MEFENKNKMSEGIGQRIIDSLKQEDGDMSVNVEVKPVATVSYEEPFVEQNQAPVYEEVEEVKYTDDSYDYEPKQEIQMAPAPAENLSSNRELSNVDILINLIKQLPSGVTKQTGAKIIRTTMESMGISMNKVLTNAQIAQEELEQNIRQNINGIENYKTKIQFLEQEIQQYKSKTHEMEDIISLFILSEKN